MTVFEQKRGWGVQSEVVKIRKFDRQNSKIARRVHSYRVAHKAGFADYMIVTEVVLSKRQPKQGLIGMK